MKINECTYYCDECKKEYQYVVTLTTLDNAFDICEECLRAALTFIKIKFSE